MLPPSPLQWLSWFSPPSRCGLQTSIPHQPHQHYVLQGSHCSDSGRSPGTQISDPSLPPELTSVGPREAAFPCAWERLVWETEVVRVLGLHVRWKRKPWGKLATSVTFIHSFSKCLLSTYRLGRQLWRKHTRIPPRVELALKKDHKHNWRVYYTLSYLWGLFQH